MSEPARRPAAAGWTLSLAELTALLEGTLEGDGAAAARSYAIDSRAVEEGTIFFALKGERTDGHHHLDEVLRRRAAAAVVRKSAPVPAGLAAIRVEAPEGALARLGRHFRERGSLRVVGVTGSAGKTTTKEFAAALLADRFRVFKSEGNLNTTIGLPLTLVRRRPEDEVAVLELGMSWPGELRRVAAIARPDVAVITNVGLAHAEHFASADEVARAKAEILEEVREGGTFVANADDARVMAMTRSFPGPVVTFGVGGTAAAGLADVAALDLEPLGAGGTRFTLATAGSRLSVVLPAVGTHQVRNALAALAIAKAVGLDPASLAPVLATLGAAEHRGRLLRLRGGVLLLDDCYNASPAAVASALDALATIPATRRVAVLGDMLELGAYADVSHREAGRHAALRADVVVGVGPFSAALVEEAVASGAREARHVPDAATAAALLAELVRDGDAVLVKASRGVGLEAAVRALEAARG